MLRALRLKIHTATLVAFMCFFSFANLTVHANQQQDLQKAIALYQEANYAEAEKVFKALLTQELNTHQKLDVYNNLGNIYADLGKNTLALKQYHKALTLAKQVKDKLTEAKIIKNIGALYLSWKNFATAEKYYLSALNTAQQTKNIKLIGDCYNNLGTVYEQTQLLQKAEQAYLTALSNYQAIPSANDVAMVYSNLAIVYKLQKLPQKAILYDLKALETAKQLNDLWMVAAISNNVGNAYKEIHDFKNAETYCNRALALADSIHATEISIITLETLASINELQNKHQVATVLLRTLIQRNDSFINQTQAKQFNELEVKYKTKEKELLNKKLLREKDLERKSFQFKLWSISLAAIASLLLVFIVYSYKQQKIRKEKELEIQKAILDSENQERFRVARELHDSVGQHLFVLRMQLESNASKEESTLLLNQTIQEVRTISHNLIPEALNFGLPMALNELLQKIKNTGQLEVTSNVNVQKEDLHFSKESELMIYRIVQELINNSLKHAKASAIGCEMEVLDNNLYIVISDNGIGFNTARVHEKGGLGWRSIFSRIKLLNGTVQIDSKPSNGTRICLTLPNVK